MDYVSPSRPIAKRTRAKEALYFKDLSEKRKKDKQPVTTWSSLTSDEEVVVPAATKLTEVEVEVVSSEWLPDVVEKTGNSVSEEVQEVEMAFDNMSQQTGRVESDAPFYFSGSNGLERSKFSFENFENVDEIRVDDAEKNAAFEFSRRKGFQNCSPPGGVDVGKYVSTQGDGIALRKTGGISGSSSSNATKACGIDEIPGQQSRGSKDAAVPGDCGDESDDDEVEYLGSLQCDGDNGFLKSVGLRMGSETKVWPHDGMEFAYRSGLNCDKGRKNDEIGEQTWTQLGGKPKSDSVDNHHLDESDKIELSSEEISDDDVEDYVLDDSSSYGSSDISDYVSEDEGLEDATTSMPKSGIENRDKRTKCDEAGSEGKEESGSEIIIGLDKEKNESEVNSSSFVQKSFCVAHRTRSRFKSETEKQEKGQGTISRPYLVDMDEISSSSGVDDNEEDDYGVEGIDSGAENVGDGSKSSGGKVGERHGNKSSKHGKRNTHPLPKDYDAYKIFIDSIWNDELFPEELGSSNVEPPSQQTASQMALPLKFRFGIEESKIPEKSEFEKELDQLWMEADFSFRSCEIGGSGSSQVANDFVLPDVETDQRSLCNNGKHQLILDEEVGIRCRFCCFVGLEIRNISPPFSKNSGLRTDKSEFDEVDDTMLNEFYSGSDCEPNSCHGRPINDKGTVWDIIPGIKDSMYQHQREGFEFIWENIAGGIYLENLKKSGNFDGGSGCIISHAPGTGKTRLTIVFLQAYMTLYPTCRPVIIAPSTMLLTWEEEFKKWNVGIPFHNLNKREFSGKENETAVNFLSHFKCKGRKRKFYRLVKLFSWRKDKSILGISYRLFEKLVSGEEMAEGKENCRLGNTNDQQIRKILFELPDLLVLDEGHTPRNEQSLIWKALSRVRTEKRIMLSGTPFQNNFTELYNTLYLVRPKFAETILSSKYGDIQKRRGRKSNAAKGKWYSLTSDIGKTAGNKLEELRTVIKPFVHIHKGFILQRKLPGMRNYVIVLKPDGIQKTLLESIQGKKNYLELGYLESLISVHPSLAPDWCLAQKECSSISKANLERLRDEPGGGVKSKFLIELIRLSMALKEKVLVFSQYIDSLTFLRDLLKSLFNWSEGRELLYMDGQRDLKQRQQSINVFNDMESDVRVLLASTRACCEGINLIGASRVVILDVVWNPSVKRQAVSRAFRLGQERFVYVYHLITRGTMELEKYYRQAKKDQLSEMVFSSNGYRNEHNMLSSTSDDKILGEMFQHAKLKDIFETIFFQPHESEVIDTFGLADG